MLKPVLLAAALAALTVGSAFAHITLEQSKAKAGSTYKAVLRIPHGCDGAATTKISVRVPAGFYAVKPQPHAGWQLSTVTGKYAKPYDNHGAKITEGVSEVSWSGGNLLDEHYDEFILSGTLAGDLPAGPIYFPVVQECTGGKIDRWIEIPAAGKSGGDLAKPAPALTIVPKP